MKVLNEINIFEMWEKLDFHYLNPQELNEKEAIYIELKNSAHDQNWALPRTITGWIVVEAWFSNMIEGQAGSYGITRLPWRPTMGLPICLAGYDNSNNGARMWFIPETALGGESPWRIRAEIKYNKRGQEESAKLFAE
ncbi:MAG: hypothetical protein FWJ66_13110 [Caldibacillus sp.]